MSRSKVKTGFQSRFEVLNPVCVDRRKSDIKTRVWYQIFKTQNFGNAIQNQKRFPKSVSANWDQFREIL